MPPHPRPGTGRLLTGLLGAQQGCGAETFTREEVSGERDQQRSRKASGERACLPNCTRTRRLRSGDSREQGRVSSLNGLWRRSQDPSAPSRSCSSAIPWAARREKVLALPTGEGEQPARRDNATAPSAGSATLHPCPETYRRSLHQDARSCDHSYPDLLSPFFLFFLFWAGQSCAVFLLKL